MCEAGAGNSLCPKVLKKKKKKLAATERTLKTLVFEEKLYLLN